MHVLISGVIHNFVKGEGADDMKPMSGGGGGGPVIPFIWVLRNIMKVQRKACTLIVWGDIKR